MHELVTVLIPFFGFPLTAVERHALRTCQEHLGDFPITFLKSEAQTVSQEVQALCPAADSVSFDERYFVNGHSYTRLLLSGALYEQLSWTRYILLLEMNTSITANQLAYWCRQGYDFIQSYPPLASDPPLIQSLPRRFNPASHIAASAERMGVFEQNNGISLRRVKACKKILSGKKRAAHHFLTHHQNCRNDSLFWEYYTNRWYPELITPNAIARRRFARSQAELDAAGTALEYPFAVSGVKEWPVQSI